MPKYNVVIVRDEDGNVGVQIGDETVWIQDDIEGIINSRILDIRNKNNVLEDKVDRLMTENSRLKEVGVKYNCICAIINHETPGY